ncbi:MAG: agmatinase [Akkermansiaceae bacterium]|nr:agmatinase [Akkermansiaceae bacterium]NNM30901.1 agmatinase [Akkermansiaceae bacterium]
MLKASPPNSSLFLEAGPGTVRGAPALLGVPFDGTASFRPGARFGPDAMRQVSDGLETYSPTLDRDLLDRPFSDFGNLIVPHDKPKSMVLMVEQAVHAIMDAGAIPFLLGGEHSLTPGAVTAVASCHKGLGVVQLDAHADLRQSYDGSKWSHACAMRRVLDHVKTDRLVQCGIRSGTCEEFKELRREKRLVAPDALDLAAAIDALGARPLYVTIDLDVFDPAVLPGTGTPEPGGIDWPLFVELLAAIPWKRVVACDVVELAPQLDTTGASSILAAKVVREVLLSFPAYQ